MKSTPELLGITPEEYSIRKLAIEEYYLRQIERIKVLSLSQEKKWKKKK